MFMQVSTIFSGKLQAYLAENLQLVFSSDETVTLNIFAGEDGAGRAKQLRSHDDKVTSYRNSSYPFNS